MRHDEVREALGRHLEGELGTTERRDVERHLAACAACRAEHGELRATVDLLRGLPDPEPPADLVPGVLRRLESAAPAPRRGFARGWRTVVRSAAPAVPIAALAASLVLLVLAGFEERRLPIPGAGSAADRGARAPRVEVARARELAAGRPSASAATPVRPLEPAPPAPARDEEFAQAPRAPLAPSTVIDADALETVALDPASGPGRPRRRSGVPAGVGAAAAPAAETGAGLPPRPSLVACVGEASARAPEAAAQCRPWLQGMLTLAQYDPRGFLAEVETLPESEAAGWLAQLASFSRETRTSEGVASRLRSTPDARVGALARWFEPGPGEPAR